MKRLIVLTAVVLLSACGLFDGRQPWSQLDPTEAETPQDEVEALVAAAIARAVVVEKDIPDYELIKDKSTVVVSEVTSDGRTLTAGAIPATNSVDFLLADSELIQNMADSNGDFLYLKVGSVDIDDNVGTISISTTWAVGKDSDVMYVSGGGYQLEYRKRDDGWIFEDILMTWIS